MLALFVPTSRSSRSRTTVISRTLLRNRCRQCPLPTQCSGLSTGREGRFVVQCRTRRRRRTRRGHRVDGGVGWARKPTRWSHDPKLQHPRRNGCQHRRGLDRRGITIESCSTACASCSRSGAPSRFSSRAVRTVHPRRCSPSATGIQILSSQYSGLMPRRRRRIETRQCDRSSRRGHGGCRRVRDPDTIG